MVKNNAGTRFVAHSNIRHHNHRLFVVVVVVAIVSSVLVGGSVYYVTTRNYNSINKTEQALEAQLAGRRFAVAANCEVQRAIIDAGIVALKSGVLLSGDSVTKDGEFVPGPLTKRLGPSYPSYPERVARARRAANAYEDRIARAVIKASGDRPPPLTGGKLDCRKLQVASRVTAETAKTPAP